MPDLEGPTPAEAEISTQPEAPKTPETNPPREAGVEIFEHYLAAPKADLSFLRQVANPDPEITQAADVPDKLTQALKFRDQLRTAFTETFPNDYPPGVALEARVAAEIEAIADTTERLWVEKIDPKAHFLSQADYFDKIHVPLKADAYRKLAEQYDFVRDTFKDQWVVFSTLGPVEGFGTQEAAIELMDSLQSDFSSYVMEVGDEFKIFSPSGETKSFDSREKAEQYLGEYSRSADTNLIIEKITDESIFPKDPLAENPRKTGFMTKSEYEHKDDPVEIPKGAPTVSDTDMAEFLAMMDARNPRNNPS